MHQKSCSLGPLTMAASLALLTAGVGCVPRPEGTVVIYAAADREYASPILGAFERRHPGVTVSPVYDVESTKTVGLVTRIEGESSRPRCDVFWNNELMHTLRLERAGLLSPVNWQVPADWPTDMRSATGRWLGIAARARILIVNRELLPADGPRPSSVSDLADPQWQAKCGLASPLFGTTATHFAVLVDQLGEREADAFFQAIKANAQILAGNKQVAQAVASGQLAFGLTDTDDALVEIDAGLPVDIVYPDQLEGQSGALRIPNTVAVIQGSPNKKAAIALANYLVSEDTEKRLAMGPSGQFPIRPGHQQLSRAQGELAIRWMQVDFGSAAENWSKRSSRLREIFRD